MHLRSVCVALLALAIAPSSHGMARKPIVTVRFHTEANARDGNSFSMPVELKYQRRSVYLNRAPDFSERQVKEILPFEAGDGTWGCLFKLDPQGRIRLETLSNEKRGLALVVIIGTKTGQHQVVDMMIDRSVSDGVITVPRGLTDLEVLALRKQFRQAGADDKKRETDEKASAPDRVDDRAETPKRRPGPEPDLPRLAD
jgi:hypothetical protein